MSFLDNLQNKADSFSEFEITNNPRTSEKPIAPTAHDVPIREDEVMIQPEEIPYYMRALYNNVKNNEQFLSNNQKRKHAEDDQPTTSVKKEIKLEEPDTAT